MKFGLILIALLHTGTAEARFRDKHDWCRHERMKMYHYQKKMGKWTGRRASCEEKKAYDRSKTCFWEIKISAHYEKKAGKWQDEYVYCDLHTPEKYRCKHDCPQVVVGLPRMG